MRISYFKSKAMVLERKKVAYLRQVGGEFLHLGVLFMIEGKIEWKINRRICADTAIMWMLYLSVVVKRKLSEKAFHLPPSMFLSLPMVMKSGS